MQYIVTLGSVIEVIKKTYFANDGDYYEKSYWPLLKDRFPNCEDYWRHFVVPATKRMEANVTDQRQRILPREHVSEDIRDLASLHYSMFMHLVHSYDHLMNPRLSSFEDFYTHLVAACDLAEDFLLGAYLLSLECTGSRSVVMRSLKKESFLKLAGDWYEKNYGSVYENYFKKGKFIPISLPGRQNVLDEYFGGSDDWREYSLHAKKIREYRNVIVHCVQIGRVITVGNIVLVPRKEYIQDYRKWPSVFAAAEDPNKLQRHFIDMKDQMLVDIETLEVMLNKLWQRPISDMKRLFLDDKNAVILGKYQITPT